MENKILLKLENMMSFEAIPLDSISKLVEFFSILYYNIYATFEGMFYHIYFPMIAWLGNGICSHPVHQPSCF